MERGVALISVLAALPYAGWPMVGVGRCKMRDDAYQMMKARASTRPRGYFIIVQCALVSNDGREKAVVFSGGSEQTILHERARRIAEAPGYASD